MFYSDLRDRTVSAQRNIKILNKEDSKLVSYFYSEILYCIDNQLFSEPRNKTTQVELFQVTIEREALLIHTYHKCRASRVFCLKEKYEEKHLVRVLTNMANDLGLVLRKQYFSNEYQIYING